MTPGIAHKLTPFALATGLAALSSGCAPAPAPAPGGASGMAEVRPCFTVAQVHNFRSAGPTTLYLRARVSEVFELQTTPCPGSDFANALIIVPDGPTDQLCPGDRARLQTSGEGTAGLTCVARVVRKLTPEQAAALPDSAQP